MLWQLIHTHTHTHKHTYSYKHWLLKSLCPNIKTKPWIKLNLFHICALFCKIQFPKFCIIVLNNPFHTLCNPFTQIMAQWAYFHGSYIGVLLPNPHFITSMLFIVRRLSFSLIFQTFHIFGGLFKTSDFHL